MKQTLSLLLACAAALALSGCTLYQEPPKPVWTPVTPQMEAEYAPYLKTGTASISGDAFLLQRGGGVVRGAGRVVTLDPATTLGAEWWKQAGVVWGWRNEIPPAPIFKQARRSTIANVDGHFSFTDLPAGKYYLRTEITWWVYNDLQGGILPRVVEVKDGQKLTVMLDRN